MLLPSSSWAILFNASSEGGQRLTSEITFCALSQKLSTLFKNKNGSNNWKQAAWYSKLYEKLKYCIKMSVAMRLWVITNLQNIFIKNLKTVLIKLSSPYNFELAVASRRFLLNALLTIKRNSNSAEYPQRKYTNPRKQRPRDCTDFTGRL